MTSNKGCDLKRVKTAYVNIKMDSYDLESNSKVVRDYILNKIKSTYFQLGRGIDMSMACD